MAPEPDEKRMRLRYAGVCRVSGTSLAARTDAIYERSTKTVRCLDCSPAVPVEPDIGTPGASARREFERRHVNREARVRARHPKLGRLILAWKDDPQSTTAWDAGALGEELLGHHLNKLSSETMRVLHDRRVPGGRGNIDHVSVTPSGIYVIDAKRYVDKRPALRIEGGLLRPRVETLLVGVRGRSKLVDGVLDQVDVVRSIVGQDIAVTGVLCFIDADWPLIGGAFTTRGVEVLWPTKLYRRLAADGPHASEVERLHRRLAAALPLA
jgi:hypothetical protein